MWSASSVERMSWTELGDRTWVRRYAEWDLNVAESEAWPDSLEAAGFTLADLADNFTTLQDLADFFAGGTLLDVALYDFGG